MKKTEDEVRRCLLLIETAFGRGTSESWTHYDFEKLSDAIHERTSVRLSVTTLKRLWGKLKYENTPTLTTLNALARFAGHADWRSFAQNGAIAETPEPATTAALERRPRGNMYWLAGAACLAVAVYFFISAGLKSEHKPLDPALFEFEANKMITEGVPNSVVFHYDATRAPDDSVYIVQTWDITRKKLVPRNKHDHSAIYYYPGFFRTKLIVDNQVVRTHDLQITSGGWLCLIENDPVPVYFRKTDYLKSDRVEVDEAMLKSYVAPHVRFFNQGDLGDLMNDNFTFETELKNDFDDGTNACHNVQVLIQCKDDIVVIPLTAKSCIGDIGLYFCGTHVQSKEADLSGFGCDLTQWTKLRVEAVNKQVTIFVNGAKAYSLTFPHDPTGIVGVQYRFNGAGATRNTRFERNGKVWDLLTSNF